MGPPSRTETTASRHDEDASRCLSTHDEDASRCLSTHDEDASRCASRGHVVGREFDARE